MNSYIALLRTPGVARIIAAQLTARFPSGMISLAFLLHMERIFDSYAAAGVVLAATSIGQAISGPLTSRLMGVLGMRRVLITTIAICSLAMTAVGIADLELWGYVVLGAITGLSYPPVQPAVRTIYPKMVNSRQLTPLFSLDASAQEIIWIAGPVVATFVGTQVSTEAAVLLCVLFLVGGSTWFVLSPEVGRVRIPRSKRRFGAVVTRPPVLVVTIVGFLVVGCCAAIEAGVVASFGEGSADSGIVLGIWAVSSLVGGLAFGNFPIGPWALARRVFVILIGSTLAIFAWEFWSLTAALVVAGICLAPALAVMFSAVSASVKFSDTAEAYGWVGTGQFIGAAAGSAIAGFLIDGVGSGGAFWASAAFALVGLAVAAIFHRSLPDLRDRDASPIPDTESVPTQPS